MSTPRLHDGMRLVPTRTAINCADLFVVSTLTKWGVRTILRSAVAEIKELVTAAVNATGIPQERIYWTELIRIEYITIQLYGSEESVRIEVWDSAPNPPLLPIGRDMAVPTNETESPVKRGYYPTTMEYGMLGVTNRVTGALRTLLSARVKETSGSRLRLVISRLASLSTAC